MNPRFPEISIVIPVYNCEHTVGKCLTSLSELEGDNYEIIVMDDGSKDQTLAICRLFKNLTIVALENGGPSRARNQGIGIARGQFVAFTDGDCIVDKQWLKQLHKGFIAPDVAGVGGDQMSPDDETPKGQAIQDFLKAIGFMGDYVKTGSVMEETEHNPSCNVMYRKQVLEEVGGFEDGLWPGEDVDLDMKIRRAGYRLVFNPKSIVKHYRPRTYGAYGKMMRRYGGAQRYLINKYGHFRILHYEPVALALSVIFISMLLWVRPELYPILFLVALLPFLFFFAKTRGFVRSLTYVVLLLVTLVCWNWGFVVGGNNESRGKSRASSQSQQ